MAKKQRILFNPYFIFPFLAWAVVGGLALMAVNKHDLFFFINSHYADSGNVVMYYITWMGQAEVIIPSLVLLPLFVRRFRNWWYFTAALACNLIPFLIQHFLKEWYNTPRPMLLYGDKPGIHFLPEWPELLHTSFPSGHSQGAFSFFCFLSLLLPPKYRIYGFVFFLCGMLVLWSRIYLAAHFFEDVYAGSMLGVILTTLVFSFMNGKRSLFINKEEA